MDDMRRSQLRELITEMNSQTEQLTQRLYHLNINSRCHGFVQHSALMYSFIHACEDRLAEDKDFTQEPEAPDAIRLSYLREKLACIYGAGFPLRLALRTGAGKLSRVRAVELRAELETLYGSDAIQRLAAAGKE